VKALSKNVMLSDGEKGNNLMLTRLTPVATLTYTNRSQQPLAFTTQIVTF